MKCMSSCKSVKNERKEKRIINISNASIVIMLTAGILFSIFILNNNIAGASSNDGGSAVTGGGNQALSANANAPSMPTGHNITKDMREKAAAKFIKSRQAAGISTQAGANTVVQAPDGSISWMPDYFGITPNYANSPLPAVNTTNGNVTGGIRKFVDALPGIPIAVPDTCPGGLAGPVADCYEIHLRQYTQKMHSDLPPTTLRGYQQVWIGNGTNVSPIQYLGPIIVAQMNRPVRVKFVNDLATTGAGGNLFIPTDTTVMGAGPYTVNWDPKTKVNGIPVSSPNTTGMFAQNRATLHLHGGNTPWISDGTMHQWITPAAEGGFYPKGVSVSEVPDMGGCSAANSGCQTFYYTNQQSARLMFYHDHAYGITRLNVYAGEAAGFLLQDPYEDDLEDGTNLTGINPFNGTPIIPADSTEIPLIIQDKTFVDNTTITQQDPTWVNATTGVAFWGTNKTGDLWFPHVYMPNQNPSLGIGGGINPNGRWDYSLWVWPFFLPTNGPVPNPLCPNATSCLPGENPLNPGTPNPSIVPEAFVDTPIVNGMAYPYFQVAQQATRFKILNAANDRTLNLQLYYASTAGPFVVFSNGSGGFGASATVTVNSTGSITGINLTSGGAGYNATNPPNVAIFDVPGHVPTAAPATGSPIASITVTAQGSGYSNQTYVSITDLGGTGTNATANISLLTFPAFGVYSIAVTNGGSNYTNPNVTIVDPTGSGSGASATATLSAQGSGPVVLATANATVDPVSGMVTKVTLLTSGSGYQVPVICNSGAIPSNRCTEVSMVPAVSGAANFPADWLVAGSPNLPPDILDNRIGGIPNPAALGPNMIQIGSEGGILPNPYTVPNRPVGYEKNPKSITITNVFERSLFLGPAERADVIFNFSAVPDGSTLILYNDAPAPVPAFDTRYDYFTDAPDQTTSGGAPSTIPGYGPNTRTVMQFQVNASLNNPNASVFNITNLTAALPRAYNASQPKPIVGQADYNAAFNANYPADAFARIDSNNMTIPGPVMGLLLTNGGSNYTSAPAVTISAPQMPGGITATATASISGVVSVVNVTKAGSNYLAAPTVIFTGGGGCCAAATANIAGSVANVAITASGSGYTSAPTVTLSPPQLAGGIQATASASISNGRVNQIQVTKAGSGYTAAPTVTVSGGGSTGAAAVATLTSLSVFSVTVTKGGLGYTTAPAVSFSGGGGQGTAATATITNAVVSLNLTNPGSGYNATPTVTIAPPANGIPANAIAILSIEFQNKGIVEDFDTDYGRMDAMLGVEIGNGRNTANLLAQTSIAYYDVDPPTEIINDSNPAAVIGSMADGTQIWKVTHNGVDTHAIHWHMFNVQLINRIGWDGTVKPPDGNEIGWKDTVRMNPLETVIVALRPIKPNVPWDLPNSIRPLDVTAPVGVAMPLQFHNVDPTNQPATTINHMVNFGWEYLWHCHLLGHEENIMMRTMALATNPNPPLSLTAASTGTNSRPRVNLSWTDNSTGETNWTIQRATSINGPWVSTVIASTTGPATGGTVSFSDTTVASGATYYYRVMAINIVGDTTVYVLPAVGYPNVAANSSPSNAASVTTP